MTTIDLEHMANAIRASEGGVSHLTDADALRIVRFVVGSLACQCSSGNAAGVAELLTRHLPGPIVGE